jgi:hypothetical protein
MRYSVFAFLIFVSAAWAEPSCSAAMSCERTVPASLVAGPAGPVVKGSVSRTKPLHSTLGAHVHVTVMDASSRVLARAIVRLALMSPKRESAGALNSTFRTSFTEEEFRGASKIKASYKPFPHQRCKTKPNPLP